MRSFGAAAAVAALAHAEQSVFEMFVNKANSAVESVSDLLETPITHKSYTNNFGCFVEEAVYADMRRTDKVVTAPLTPYHRDYAQQHSFLKSATEFHQRLNASNDPSPTWGCSEREPTGSPTSAGAFLPVFDGEVSEANPTATYAGKCFEEITFEYEKVDETSFNVKVHTAKPRDHLCDEVILFANTEIQHFEVFFFKGNHKVQFKMNTPETQADVAFGGIKMFGFCDNAVQGIESLFNFAKAFVGGLSDHPHWPYIGSHVPEYMEKANVEFLSDSMGLQLEKRAIRKVEIDPDLIQSGDFIAIMRLDGLDPIIMYGTGSHIGHSTMALRFDGELYIVESQDAWYWPTHGLQRTKWADWIKQAEEASFHVSWLPLNAEQREKFDEKAAQDFFFQTEGLPYGYHNFLYGWIDTANDNWPPLLAKEFAPVLFKFVEDIVPKTAYIFFTEALNKRLGVDGKNISEIAALAAEQGLSVEDVMAMVEQDGWEYTGMEPRDGLSYVCSAYVAAQYKAAGLFDDMEINATEFGPRDVYSLAFFDEDIERPNACVDADPDLPYCQLLGTYRMTLPDYNTVEPYPHMAERCTINWPSYSRDEGC